MRCESWPSARLAATAEITELINFIHADKRGVVTKMELSSARVSAGVDLSTNEAMIKMSEIASATHEQSAASNEIARHIERTAQMTEENSSAARKALDLAGQLEGYDDGLHGELSAFKTGYRLALRRQRNARA